MAQVIQISGKPAWMKPMIPFDTGCHVNRLSGYTANGFTGFKGFTFSDREAVVETFHATSLQLPPVTLTAVPDLLPRSMEMRD
jgi:hypothetical protein